MGIQISAPNTKLVISEFIGPIGITTHSRHAGLLLGIHIYFEVRPAHLPLTINTRHWHQLIHRMFKALQTTWCREKATCKDEGNNQYYIKSSIAIILLHLMGQRAREHIRSNLAIQYYLGEKEQKIFHSLLWGHLAHQIGQGNHQLQCPRRRALNHQHPGNKNS